MANPQTTSKTAPAAAKKTAPAPAAEVWDEGKTAAPAAAKPAPAPEPEPEPTPVSVATEPAPAAPAAPAAPRAKRKVTKRTPLAQRLSAAPTPARKAIIIEAQLEMVDKRRASILSMVTQDVLDNVNPKLLNR